MLLIKRKEVKKLPKIVDIIINGLTADQEIEAPLILI